MSSILSFSHCATPTIVNWTARNIPFQHIKPYGDRGIFTPVDLFGFPSSTLPPDCYSAEYYCTSHLVPKDALRPGLTGSVPEELLNGRGLQLMSSRVVDIEGIFYFVISLTWSTDLKCMQQFTENPFVQHLQLLLAFSRWGDLCMAHKEK